MDALGHSVTFPVNEMLLTDEGAASDSVVVNEMGAGGQQSFVFSSEGGTATLLSLPFALLHDSGLATLPTSTTGGASTAAQPIGGTNTTNIIIKQSGSSVQPGLPTNTIFLDAAQMALLSSGEGQVVLTDAFLEEGQQGAEGQQIFFQVTSDALHEEDETAGQKDDSAMVQQSGIPLNDIRGRGQNIVIPERRPVLPKAKRGPGRPRRDDSKMPPSVKGVWFCQSCGKEFSKWPLLKKHMKTHSDDKPHRCSHCPASFNVPWNLKLHESTHVSPTSPSGGPLRCPACTRTFSRIASLKAHVMLHEEDESLFCTVCGEEFSTQGALDEHLRIHDLEARNVDPLADDTAPTVGLENAVWLPDGSAHFGDAVHSFVSTDQQVVSGMLTDSPRAGHRCRLCNAIFRKAGQLREHMKEHSKVKASLLRRNHKRNIDRSTFLHKCKNCSKGFQKPSQLVRHMRIHTGERPYKCLTCDRAFNQKGSLQIHMTKHSGVKPFTCEFCSAGFRQRGNLRAHILRVHTIPVSGEQAFRCCECPCVFRKLGSLNAHVSRVHGHSTSSANGLSRKRKRADGSTVGDSLDDDVSDVLKDLAELEEATRGLGGGVGNTDGRTQDSVRRVPHIGVVGEGLKDSVGEGPHPSDILQQALEKSGLSGKKTGAVSESPHQEAGLVQMKATVAERTEEDGSLPLDAIVATDSNHSTSHSCVLTLADKAHDGTVRRYSIKVRRLGGVRWHQCTYCPKEFKKPSDLVRHIRIHTHEKPYKCNMCFRAFAVKSTLTVHLRIHSGLKSYECSTCKKKFASQSSLKVHQRLHSGLKPFSCPYCSLRFRTTGHRKTHISSHFRVRFRTSKKQRQRMEEQAAKEDIRRVYLQDPIVVQQPQEEIPANTQESGDDPSPVLQEGETVAPEGGEVAVPEARGAQDEMRVVIMDNRPHGCEHCPAAFKKFAHLKQHLRSHTGEKPFGCTTCNKAFVSKSVLKSHLKTHVPFMAPSRRPYSCSECGRKFVASSSLKRHMINAHENLRKKLLKETFLCPYCSCPPFNSSRACRKHILTHTGELLEALEREVEQERAQATAQPEGGNEQVGEVQPPRPILVLDGTQRVANMRLENGRIPEGTQLAVVPKGQENEPIHKETASEPVMEDCETDNVVVTFSLDFPATDALGRQVINHQVSLDGQEEDGAGTQTVATISLADTDGLSQDSLRQIEQSLSTGMFGEAIEAGAGASSTTVEHHGTQEAIKDTGTAALDLHAISFDPSVFSNITLPPGESLNLHASLQPMEEDGIANPVPEATPETADRLEEGDDKDDELRGRKKKVHKCTFCHRIFKKCSHLKQHLRTHTGEKPFQCLVCMRMFVTMGTLKAHFRTHTGEKSFACETCGAHFTTNGSLRRHMIAHSNEGRIFQCERCQQGFRTVGNWRRHWRSHEKELIGSRGPGATERSEDGEARQAEGVVAELESVAEGAGTGVVEEGMKQGQEVVEAPTPQEEGVSIPNQAPVNFKRIGLKRRNGTSSGVGATAGISGGVIRLSEEETTRLAMQSPSQPHLTLSERVLIASAAERERISEINDKQRQLQLAPKLPHVCPHCPKSFRKPSDLARHVRTHTGERPFACDKCGRRFTVKSTLDSHRMTHPLEDGDGSLLCHPKYPCHVCGCLFATKGSLKVHMRLHTGARPFKCPQCEQRFRTSGHRKAHLLTHVRSQQALGIAVVGGVAREAAGRRGRGRRAKTMALEAMRTIDEALRDAAAECAQEGAGVTNTTTAGDEEEVGGGVVDWATTLHANLAAAGGEEGAGVGSAGGGKATFVHLGQLDDGLILGQVPQHPLDDDEDANARGGGSIAGQRLANVGAIDAVATGVEGVVESLSFEGGDEVGGLFGGQSLEVILENKSQHFRGVKGMSSKGDVAEESTWGSESNVRGRSLGVLDEEGNISLVIDGDFVIEEDGTLRQVVGGECVVLSGLGRCDDGNSDQVIDEGQR